MKIPLEDRNNKNKNDLIFFIILITYFNIFYVSIKMIKKPLIFTIISVSEGHPDKVMEN